MDGALEREFVFDGFPDAIAFVNRVAELAEAENHHPDIAISYRTSPSAGGRTAPTRSPTATGSSPAKSAALA